MLDAECMLHDAAWADTRDADVLKQMRIDAHELALTEYTLDAHLPAWSTDGTTRRTEQGLDMCIAWTSLGPFTHVGQWQPSALNAHLSAVETACCRLGLVPQEMRHDGVHHQICLACAPNAYYTPLEPPAVPPCSPPHLADRGDSPGMDTTHDACCKVKVGGVGGAALEPATERVCAPRRVMPIRTIEITMTKTLACIGASLAASIFDDDDEHADRRSSEPSVGPFAEPPPFAPGTPLNAHAPARPPSPALTPATAEGDAWSTRRGQKRAHRASLDSPPTLSAFLPTGLLDDPSDVGPVEQVTHLLRRLPSPTFAPAGVWTDRSEC